MAGYRGGQGCLLVRRPLERLINLLRFVEACIAAVAYAAVAILLMSDVIGREIFGQAFLGTQQLAVYAAILAGFLGLTLATSDNSHLRPEFMDFALRRFGDVVERIGDVISFVFFLASAYVAWTFVAISMDAGDRAPVLYFVVWPLQLVLPYAFVSAGLKHLAFAFRPDLKPRPDAPAA